MPIGKTWQMIAVDALTVPISPKDNYYLLVAQDYFTKWADATPLADQSACTITAALFKLFSVLGCPFWIKVVILKSAMLKQSLEAFGIAKSRTTAYHPEGDGMVERFNCSLMQLL